MLDRRTFLGTTAAMVIAQPWRARGEQMGKLGLQLYTVRDEMAKDVEGTLAKVAAAGYTEVEFAGYFNTSPKEIRAMLDRQGLTAPATHVDLKTITDKLPEVLETARTIGHQYVVLPYLDDATRVQPGIWKRVADTLNASGAAGRQAGVQFAYHNHQFEFAPVNGTLPFDLLLETCDPQVVKMEMDICWVTAAGKDPIAYFRKYPGRFPMVHVKDVKKIPPNGAATPIGQILPDVTDVGTGIIDWKTILAGATSAGVTHFFVEHDRPAQPFASIKASHDYLRALRF